jgi:hypothetical protein
MDAMKRNPDDTTMEMRPGQIERLRDAAGARLICHRGIVWITQEGLLRDDFLSAGMSIKLVTTGLTLIDSIGQAGARLSIESDRSDAEMEKGDESAAAYARSRCH